MAITRAQQEEIYEYIKRQKNIRRGIRKLISWVGVFIFSILNYYINVTSLPTLTTFSQGFFFEIGVLAIISFLNYILLLITYKNNTAVAVVAVAPAVAIATVAVLVVAAPLLIAVATAGAVVAIVAVAAAVAVVTEVVTEVVVSEGLIERD